MKTTSPSQVLTVADDATTSSHIQVAGFERGSVGRLPTGFVTTGITLQVTNEVDSGGTPTGWTTVADTGSTPVSALATQAAGEVFGINSNVFNFRFFRLSFADAQTGGPLEIPIFLAAND